MKKNLLLTLSCLAIFLTVTSCHKETPVSDVTIENDTYTDLAVTLDGKSYTIPYGNSQTFTANAGSAITGQVTTSGGTASAPVGITLTWPLDGYNFPASGTEVIPIDASSDYFYLTLKNISGSTVTQIIVNNGLTAQTTDNVSIPSDGNIYGVGYYQAFSNSNLQVNLYNSTYLTWASLNLPFTSNQQFPAVAN